ncbi:MAG: hypothetical protein LAQ30_24820 [Acidobacteriia bacterium]|nr:hypothetical protein [Terriglobia bacterium]
MFLALFAGALCAQPNITSVVNSANPASGLAPGAMADVLGDHLPASVSTDPQNPSATVGGIPVTTIVSHDTGKWVIVIPWAASQGKSTVQVGFSNAFSIDLKQYAPALFGSGGIVSAQGFANGVVQGAGYPLSASTPARLGDLLVLNATGLGPAMESEYWDTVDLPTVTIGGVPLLVVNAYWTSQKADCLGSACIPGMYQVMVGLPVSLQVRDQPIFLSIGGLSSQTLTVPVNNLPILNGVVNAASFDPKAPLVPGALASVFGTTFGVADQLNGFPSTDFNGVSVSFNGAKAPLLAVVASKGQINLQVPTDLPEGGPATVKVTTPDGSSTDLTVQMASAAPGVFFLKRRNAAAQFANTVWIPMPDDLAQEYGMAGNCRASNPAITTLCGEPAHPQDFIQIYATGLGKAALDGDPAKGILAAGVTAPANGALYKTLSLPTVTVGGQNALVSFSGIAPGFAGLYQINIQIPDSAPAGDYVPIVVTMPNGSKDDTTTIAIRKP